jgi:hypothetical protein
MKVITSHNQLLTEIDRATFSGFVYIDITFMGTLPTGGYSILCEDKLLLKLSKLGQHVCWIKECELKDYLLV